MSIFGHASSAMQSVNVGMNRMAGSFANLRESARKLAEVSWTEPERAKKRHEIRSEIMRVNAGNRRRQSRIPR